MPAQIGDWLADLAGADPESAAEVGAALLALMTAGAIPGRPLVIAADEQPPSLYPEPDEAADPREALDLSYHHMLEGLQKIRREVADAATSRHSIEIQLGAENLDQAMRAALERQLAAARGLETALTRPSQQLQMLVDRFRTAKETAKAVATATEASARIKDTLDAFDAVPDAADATPRADDIERAGSESAARSEQTLAHARRLLTAVRASDPAAACEGVAGPVSRPAKDVLELQADPLGSGSRLLFAEEPTGTLTLLAVLDDARAVGEHHDSAIDLAGRLLAEIRAEGWPAESLELANNESFTTHFFAGRGPELTARATSLAAVTLLTNLRERHDMSMAQVAGRAGLSEGQVKLLELQGARDAEVEVLAAYVRALGGSLRLTASIDGLDYRLG
jgi:phage shock protein A